MFFTKKKKPEIKTKTKKEIAKDYLKKSFCWLFGAFIVALALEMFLLPNKIPPNIVASNKSFVAGCKFTAIFVAKESIAVAIKVFNMNFLPRALNAISINGIFIQKIKRPKFHLVK